MRAVDLIRRKRDGEALSNDEMAWLVREFTAGSIPDYQLAAFLMAVYFRGLNAAETRTLTWAMLHSGKVLHLNGSKPVADKHSTGGVGDKTSLIVAPLAACFDVLVPMISGRGLEHTGGTLDKLESIPGFCVNLNGAEFEGVLRKAGCAIVGATEEIAPADKRLYALRDVTATVDNLSLITASILSKKLAEGLDALVVDVKTGSGAFMRSYEDARALAQMMVAVAGEMNVRTLALITDMEQPLGCAIGNAVEVIECLDVLRGGGPDDLVELSVELTARLVCLAGVDRRKGSAARAQNRAERLEHIRARCRELLQDGTALERFVAMAEAQRADTRILREPALLPRARFEHVITANRDGFLSSVDARDLGLAVMLAGAGRAKADDRIDPAAGIRLYKKRGQPVKAGEALCTVLYNDEARLGAAQEMVQRAFVISDHTVQERPLIHEVIGAA
jgi:pyrimidine-nucleoside phosphorylase/thymidine phosphorylase